MMDIRLLSPEYKGEDGWQATGIQQGGSDPIVSVMLISPSDAVDIAVDGHEAALDNVSENGNAFDCAEDDVTMPEFMPTGVESAQEADAKNTRCAERIGTEAEWEEVVNPSADAEVPPVPRVLEECARAH